MSILTCRQPVERTSTCPLGGAFEQLVLLAVIRREGCVHGRVVDEEIRRRTARRVSLRAVHRTLKRLQERQLLERVAVPGVGWMSSGRARAYYRVTVHGRRALRLALRATDSMRAGLPGLGLSERLTLWRGG